MADDINTCTGFGSNDADKRITGPIKNGTPVVQAPRKSFNTNNFVDEDTILDLMTQLITPTNKGFPNGKSILRYYYRRPKRYL